LGINQLGREADHSPPSSTEVKEWVELYLHSRYMPSWYGPQSKKAQGQLYLYFLFQIPHAHYCTLHFTALVIILIIFDNEDILQLRSRHGQKN
jgi:hypothetical protein